mmetsp:Transcript_19348/g.62944  ORF Transcript_19348/g.62944 Transcript_19348/m.62944 type:complete len:201 (-) Transcript_19348:116-718(-)
MRALQRWKQRHARPAPRPRGRGAGRRPWWSRRPPSGRRSAQHRESRPRAPRARGLGARAHDTAPRARRWLPGTGPRRSRRQPELEAWSSRGTEATQHRSRQLRPSTQMPPSRPIALRHLRPGGRAHRGWWGRSPIARRLSTRNPRNWGRGRAPTSLAKRPRPCRGRRRMRSQTQVAGSRKLWAGPASESARSPEDLSGTC